MGAGRARAALVGLEQSGAQGEEGQGRGAAQQGAVCNGPQDTHAARTSRSARNLALCECARARRRLFFPPALAIISASRRRSRATWERQMSTWQVVTLLSLPALAAAAWGAGSAAEAGPVAPPNVTLTLLGAAAAQIGARCLDGSPGGLYIDVGAEAGKWIVFTQGGGWCSSPEACLQRANTSLGSTTFLPRHSTTIMADGNGYLSNDPSINPIMYNWTRVYMRALGASACA